MELIKSEIDGLLIIKPKIFEDDRGYFYESYNNTFLENVTFVQDNESKSCKNVIRGMHFQIPPYEQGKLVRVIKGSVLDVAVDIRKDSPTYKQWKSVVLSEWNKLMFWIPPGFAHGFRALEDDTIFFYKCTNYYNKDLEGSFIWNDPDINIDWFISDPIISEKDKNSPSWSQMKYKIDI